MPQTKEEKATYMRKWFAEHKEQTSRLHKIWLAAHPDAIRKHNKTYRKKHQERIREYDRIRATATERREITNKRRIAWTEGHPEETQRAYLLRLAVEQGKIKKSESCESCGRKVRIEGHHPNPISLDPDPLKVIWLCTSCHRTVHAGRD